MIIILFLISIEFLTLFFLFFLIFFFFLGGISIRIGSSICEGKLIKFPKPLLVTQKYRSKNNNEIPMETENPMDSTSNINNESSNNNGLRVCAIIRQKIVFAQRPKPIVAQLNKTGIFEN